jgi:hypothetical protein
MSPWAVVFERLKDATTAGKRIYPLLLPQEPTYPAITFQQISSIPLHAMGQDAPLLRVRVQVNSWGRTYAESRTLAGEVEGRLSRYRGPVGTVQVLDVLLDNELEGYEAESQSRRVIQDYTIFIAR